MLEAVERVHGVSAALEKQALNGGLRLIMGNADGDGTTVAGGLLARGNLAVNGNWSVSAKKEKDKALQFALKISSSLTKRYHETIQRIGELQGLVYVAMAEGAKRLNEADKAIESTLNLANRLPDGTEIFLAVDGSVYDRNLRELDEHELVGVELRENAPSWEVYEMQLNGRENAQAYLDRAHEIDRELFDIHTAAEESSEQMTDDRLDDLAVRLDAFEQELNFKEDASNEFEISKPDLSALPRLRL